MPGRPSETQVDPADRDERLGEAIEEYLALAEAGRAPEPSAFAAGYPELEEDLVAALGGLALVKGLVGDPGGPGHRLESGRRVAGYRIVRELGRGGMGIVYEAVHVGLDRPVALKVLGSSAAPDSGGRRRFLNEAKTAAGLHHTHIVPVFDVGQVGGLCYYAMQRIEGSGLDRVIKHLRRDRAVAAGSTYPGGTPRATPPPAAAPGPPEPPAFGGETTATWAARPAGGHAPDRDEDDEPTPFEPPRGSAYYRWVAGVGEQAAEALAHAHQRGVIHRDVKPSNLLVDARGTIWMADFGLARRLADPSQTQIDSLLGTPRYMSPEQARIGPIDGRSDVYSLGATLYELITLRPPFEGRTAAELIDQIATRDPSPIRGFDPKVPRDLETIVMKALQKRAVDRYATAADLAEDLNRYLHHEPVRARRIGPLGRAWRVARRHPSLTIVSAVAAAAVVATSTIAYVRVLQERDEARKARGESQRVAAALEAANLNLEGTNYQLEEANLEAHDALGAQFLQEAETVRTSAVVDRRVKGLGLLTRAAEFSPGPARRARLRDEAVALLATRDVAPRPAIPMARPASVLAFGRDGRHVATLSDDFETVRLWDVESRSLVATHEMGAPVSASADTRSPARGPERPRGLNPMSPLRFGTRIAAFGPDLAVLHPDGKGIRLLDAATGTVSGNLRLFDRTDPAVGPPAPRNLAGREILSLAASADGRRLLTVDRPADGEGRRGRPLRGDSRVLLWDPMNPDVPLARLAPPKVDPRGEARDRSPVLLAAISPDGSTAAVAQLHESEIQLYTRDGRAQSSIDSQAQLNAVALGPEGLLAAVGNRAVHLWNLNNNNAFLTYLTPTLGLAAPQIHFSPDDGTLLAISGRWSGVEVWDIAAASCVASIATPEEPAGSAMAMAPGGRRLAIGLADSLASWDVVDPMAQVQIAGSRSPVNSLAFSPGGELAMASMFDGTLRRWSPDRCPTASRVVEPARATSVAFDARGRLIAQGRVARADAEGRPVATGPDLLFWFSGDDDAVARLDLPARSPMLDHRYRNQPAPGAQRIARTADGRTIALTRPNEVLLARLGDDGTPGPVVRLRSPDLPEDLIPDRMRDLPPPPSSRGGGPFPPPSAFAGGRAGDPAGPPFVRWRDVAISPEGDRLYLASLTTQEVTGWAIRGDRLERLPWTPDGKFQCLALAPDGRTLAVGDRAGIVLLLDPADGHTVHRLGPPQGDPAAPVGSLAFSPDGAGLAVATRDQVRLWSLAGPVPTPFVRLPGHRGLILSLAYDPRGHLLATGGEDKIVRVWDLDRVRRELARLGLD